MKKALAWFGLVAMIAAFAFSLAMMRQFVGVASPWFGLTAMFAALGICALARPVFLPKLPAFLGKTYAWETKGAAYRALRVPAFGTLLRRTPLRFLNTDVYLARTPDPSVMLAQLEAAEAAHYAAALVLVPYMVIAHREGKLGAAACFWILQVGGNLYPILHLRWTRVRLGRLEARRRRPSPEIAAR